MKCSKCSCEELFYTETKKSYSALQNIMIFVEAILFGTSWTIATLTKEATWGIITIFIFLIEVIITLILKTIYGLKNQNILKEICKKCGNVRYIQETIEKPTKNK